MSNSFGMALKRIRNRQGFSLRQLENQSGVSYSYISQIERGQRKTPKVSTLKKIAHGLRVNYNVILGIAGYLPEMPSNIIKPRGYIKIPVVGSIPCGDPNTAIRETDEYKLVPVDDKTAGMFFLRADGHSMEPKIENHSLVKIHKQNTVENGEIAVVSVNENDATLKQAIFKPNGKIDRFQPINKHFKPIYPDEDHRCRIVGKAVSVENPL